MYRSVIIFIITIILLQIISPVYATVHQTDWEMAVKYYNDHLIGKVYVNQGSPDADPDYYGDLSIHLFVDKSAPQNPETLRVSAFWRIDGDPWYDYCGIIPIAINTPEVHVKKYEDYYYSSADEEWEIYFSDPARYVDGSGIPYDQLESVVKAIISLLASTFGLPDPSSLVFDLIDDDDDPIFSGVMTDHITVSLKTGSFLWQDFYDAKHGSIRTELNFAGAGSWAAHHSVGYSDWIDFDAKYTVEWGYWYQSLLDHSLPVWISLGEEQIYLCLVNVEITLSD